MEAPLVKNAADPSQVAQATEKEKLGRDLELDDLRKVLGTESGRRLLWRFIKHAGVHESIWEPSAAIHYRAGKQDFGHFIESEILEANEEALFQMMREAGKFKKSKKEKHNARSY
jgi:hypothetical protein